MKVLHSFALASSAAALLAACGGPSGAVNAAPVDAPVKTTAATSKTAAVSETDARIEASFKKTHIFEHYLSEDKIVIHSVNGNVTLTGEVAEVTHKPMAENVVAALPGVKTVSNQLQWPGVPEEEKSDAWIGSKIKVALLFHRNVNASGTKVDVKDGIVTLSGEAVTEAQKELTTEYAKDVDGVKDVKNAMTVAPGPAPETKAKIAADLIDDASIVTQVKMSLLVHKSTSAIKTKVAAKDGVVTVSGAAKNGAEKDLVTKLVADIHGVTTVVNNMEIAPEAPAPVKK